MYLSNIKCHAISLLCKKGRENVKDKKIMKEGFHRVILVLYKVNCAQAKHLLIPREVVYTPQREKMSASL